MAIDNKEITINGKKFLITQFNGSTGLKLQIKLMKHLGPAFAELLDSPEPEGSEEAKGNITGMIKALVMSLDEVNTPILIKELLANTKLNNQDIRDQDFNFEFAGDYKTLFQLLKEIVEFNFGDFFAEGGILSLFKNQ